MRRRLARHGHREDLPDRRQRPVLAKLLHRRDDREGRRARLDRGRGDDDSEYGQQGAKALAEAFGSNAGSVPIREVLPSGGSDLTPQVLRARRSGATALLVWAEPAAIANVVIAARTSGWDVPVYTPASGEDPLLRQQLADHRDWIPSVTFAA